MADTQAEVKFVPTIQTGAKKFNKPNTDKFCYWLNGVDVTDQNLDQFDPYIQGVSRIFLYKPAPFMNTQYPSETTRFKHLIETGYTSINGIQDTQVETVEFEGGFGGQKFRNVSLASNDTDTISITVYEQSGSPLREYLDAWVTGMRDLYSNIAHYHGAIDDKTPYGEKNHTAEFVYVTLDPTGKTVEYAALLAHAFPLVVPKSHLNYESRNRANVPMEMQFAVQLYESPAINALANYLIAQSAVDYNYLNFTPNPDATRITAAQATKYSTGNRLSSTQMSDLAAAKMHEVNDGAEKGLTALLASGYNTTAET